MPEEDIRRERAQEDTTQADGKSAKPWLKWLLIGVGIIALIGAELGISYIVNRKILVPNYLSAVEQKQQEGSEEKAMEEESDALNSNIYMLDNIVINPTGTNGTRYIALSIGLGVVDGTTLKALQQRDIQVRDAINTLLANKSLGEFVDMGRRPKLKQEIINAVNEKIHPRKVGSIYFTEYVIQ